jgi:hypothetical protein
MGNKIFSAHGLKLELEEKPEETIVHCSGKITAESAEMFQSEIRGHVIPASRGKGVAVTCRIVLDLSQVTPLIASALAPCLRSGLRDKEEAVMWKSSMLVRVWAAC